jgi:hypothetical protein
MKHTPGPWKAVTYSGEFDQPLVTSNDGFIARLNSFSNRQHEANAKLIAAAPEMLEALQAVWDYLKLIKTDYPMVERAIKKATE